MIESGCCRKGHPYTEENTRIDPRTGWRQCRQCDKEKAQATRDRKRGDKPKFQRDFKERCFRDHLLEGDNVYWYKTRDGKEQRRCRACEEIRRQERIASGETTQPTKTHCDRGHEMKGDNLTFRRDGFAVCRACAVIRTQRSQDANRDEYLGNRKRVRRQKKNEMLEEFKSRVVAIYASGVKGDELIQRLRDALPPAEQ